MRIKERIKELEGKIGRKMKLMGRVAVVILAILAGIVGGIALVALLTKLGEIKKMEAEYK